MAGAFRAVVFGAVVAFRVVVAFGVVLAFGVVDGRDATGVGLAVGAAGVVVTGGACPAASAAVVVRRSRGTIEGFARASGTDVDAIGAVVGGVGSVGGVGDLRRAIMGADSLGPTPGSVAVGT